MPSASTELFLRMEAAAAHEPEEATLGILDSSQPFGMPVWQHASDEQHAALSVQCTSLPLSAQAPVFHIQQQQQQRQQPPEHEEDLYAGLERGADASTGLLPSWHAAVATTTVPQQAEGAPADAVKHDMVSSHAVPIHGPGGTAPEQGFSAKGPEHGSSRYRDPAGAQCDAELREKGKLAPKAAEAPLVKQGSYAVAAKLARLRSKRRQQEIEELIASRRQTQVASGGKQPAVQVTQTPPS